MGGWRCTGASRESLGVSDTEDVRLDAARLKGTLGYRAKFRSDKKQNKNKDDTHSKKNSFSSMFFLNC